MMVARIPSMIRAGSLGLVIDGTVSLVLAVADVKLRGHQGERICGIVLRPGFPEDHRRAVVHVLDAGDDARVTVQIAGEQVSGLDFPVVEGLEPVVREIYAEPFRVGGFGGLPVLPDLDYPPGVLDASGFGGRAGQQVWGAVAGEVESAAGADDDKRCAVFERGGVLVLPPAWDAAMYVHYGCPCGSSSSPGPGDQAASAAGTLLVSATAGAAPTVRRRISRAVSSSGGGLLPMTTWRM
jgi:hypothetical protein